MVSIAEHLVRAVLDADESPKDFLKRKNVRRHRPIPPIDEVHLELYREDEDMDWDGNFGDQQDQEWVRDQLEAGNEWAWCKVQVKASFADADGNQFEGNDYLGGCSYRSREDFMGPGGYYDDMKSVAYREMVKQMEDFYTGIHKPKYAAPICCGTPTTGVCHRLGDRGRGRGSPVLDWVCAHCGTRWEDD